MDDSVNDIELMARIAGQDQGAFRTLYQAYSGAIYSLACRVLGDTTLAEEVTQDTFLKVWGHKAHWNPDKGALKSWLLSVTHFTAIDRLRRENRQPALHPEAIEEVEARSLFGANGRHEVGWQEGVVLRTLVAHLSKDQATLIDLAFFQGLSHSEIADKTGIPLGTVKTRLRSGLERLRELWQDSNATQSNPTRADVRQLRADESL